MTRTIPPKLILAATLTMLMSPSSSSAETFVVNDTRDVADAQCDGVCATSDGKCTLRAAVQEANCHPGPDVISLVPDAVNGTESLTYVLDNVGPQEDQAATGDLDIMDDLSIIGAGALRTTIDGNGTDRASTSAGLLFGRTGRTHWRWRSLLPPALLQLFRRMAHMEWMSAGLDHSGRRL